jgi:hypothetical protein
MEGHYEWRPLMSNLVSLERRNRYKGIRDRETSLVLVLFCAAATIGVSFASYAVLYLLSVLQC